MAERPASGRSGIPVDFVGAPTIDPTENVKSLQEASSKRQDDLREASNHLTRAELAHIKEIVTLRGEISVLRDAHQTNMATLRAQHQAELNVKEAARIDAIRDIDQLNAATVAAQSLQAVTTLAATVQTTAQTVAATLASTIDPINKRLQILEQSSYEGKGRQTRDDPQFVEMMSTLEAVRTGQATSTGKVAGVAGLWGYIIGALGLGAALYGVFLK